MLADDFPLESVTASLLKSPELLVFWLILLLSLDGLHLSYFQFLQSLYQSFDDCTEHTNYNCYHCRFDVPWFFSSLARSRYLSLFTCLQWYTRTVKSSIWQVLLLMITRSGCLAKIRWSVCNPKPLRILCISFSKTDSGLLIVHIPFVRMVKFKRLAQFPVDHFAHLVVSSLILSLC